MKMLSPGADSSDLQFCVLSFLVHVQMCFSRMSSEIGGICHVGDEKDKVV
jgi:hypothetical protein